jgi:hypothetical protein
MSMYVRQGIVVPSDGIGASNGSGESASLRTEREQTMHEYGIGFDGLRYDFHGYRYDRLADALAYARLMRMRPTSDNPRGPYVRGATVVGPSESDRRSMATLGIGYDAGTYRYETFRYDRLGDAVRYAEAGRAG